MLLRLRRTGIVYLLMVLALITAVHTPVAGQSQALNGQIEGGRQGCEWQRGARCIDYYQKYRDRS